MTGKNRISLMSDTGKTAEAGRIVMSIIVRFAGLILLFAGLWIAFQVLTEALKLYNDPERIERFAVAIEKGSNIDKTLVSIQDTVIDDSPVLNDDSPVASNSKTASERKSSNDIRISYFLAWIIVLLLLLMIARISLSAMKIGGELVLYDVQIKQFARMILKEVNRQDK
jgi:hypothetical protein